MSVLAYRRYPNQAESFSFDLWHDSKLVDFLNKETGFYLNLNAYGTGIVDIPVEILDKIVASREELELDEDTINQIRSDIEDGRSRLGEVVSYHCY